MCPLVVKGGLWSLFEKVIHSLHKDLGINQLNASAQSCLFLSRVRLASSLELLWECWLNLQ